MKEFVRSAGTAELCVLRACDAMVERTGKFRDFIAFGDWTDGVGGPTVRFHGGTAFSGQIQNAPQISFNIFGDCQIENSEWMNRENCPNVFDESYTNSLIYFIQTNLPILLLVYNRNLDKEDALSYFRGIMSWEGLISSVYRIPDEAYAGIVKCQNNAQLHTFCVRESIYGANESLGSGGRALLCVRLETSGRPIFETYFDGEETILVGYNGHMEQVCIPAEIDRIGKDAFAGHTEIRKVIFSDSLQAIEAGAFRECTGIELLIIPSGVAFIEENAFRDCTALRHVCCEETQEKQPSERLVLERGCFDGCRSLESVRLREDLESWGNPFSGCPNLREIEISGSDTNAIIYSDCLWVGCNGTAIPNGVKQIDSGAFDCCPGLKELEIPDSVIKIAEDAFVDCPNLIILCSSGSYAEKHARQHNIPYRYVDC